MKRRNNGHPAMRSRGLLVRYLADARGMGLVITLFVVALVTVLVLEYYFDASIEIDLAANYADDVRAYHLALSGVGFAQAVLQRDDDQVDSQKDLWYTLSLIPTCFPPQQLLTLASEAATGPLTLESTEKVLTEDGTAEGCVWLRITDEQSKLPINVFATAAGPGQNGSNGTTQPPGTRRQPGTTRPPGATPNQEEETPPGKKKETAGPKDPKDPSGPTGPQDPGEGDSAVDTWKPIFENFFTSFHIEPEKLEALLDWVDTDPEGSAEDAYYEGLEHPYKSANGPMHGLGELRQVRGFDAETLAKLFREPPPPERIPDVDLGENNYFTVYGDNKVNLNTAPPEVLVALLTGLQGSSGNIDVSEIEARQKEQPFEKVEDFPVQVTDLANVADVKSTHFRVVAVGQVGVVRKRVVAVLHREGGQGGTNGQGAAPKIVYLKVE